MLIPPDVPVPCRQHTTTYVIALPSQPRSDSQFLESTRNRTGLSTLQTQHQPLAHLIYINTISQDCARSFFHHRHCSPVTYLSIFTHSITYIYPAQTLLHKQSTPKLVSLEYPGQYNFTRQEDRPRHLILSTHRPICSPEAGRKTVPQGR